MSGAGANGAARCQPPSRSGLKVFIVGGPRSGTSVLTRAMRLVFDLPGHGESHMIPAVGAMTYSLRRYLERFKANKDDLLVRRLTADPVEGVVFDFLRDFYADVYGGDSWVDKTPSDESVHSIALIRRIFPDARVIVTRRNGIEAVRSQRAKFGVGHEDACVNWASVMAGIELARERCPDALEIDHRDLVHATDDVAAACARHLGRPDRAGALATFLREDWQDRFSEPPGPRPTTLADTEWPEDDKATFRHVCGPWMTAFGYAMDRLAEPARARRPAMAGGRRASRAMPA